MEIAKTKKKDRKTVREREEEKNTGSDGKQGVKRE